MYAGHAALALLAKAKRPQIAIALLVPIAFAPDWVEWVADALGHHNREISHSIVSVGIGASVIALIYWLRRRVAADAAVVWLVYASHWPADYVTGLKPTWPGGPMVGLLLYTRPTLDALLESALIVACWLAYRRSLPPPTRHRAILALVPLGLIAMQLGFEATQPFGALSQIGVAALSSELRSRTRPSTLNPRPCSFAACLLQGSPPDSTRANHGE